MESAPKLLIEHQCPQCGAPATLEETDRLFTCAFCRVKSFLTHSGFFHYLLPHSKNGDEEVVYLPYWRLKGIFFWSVRSGIKHRIVDVSWQAVSSPHFPISLGLRSQTMKLRFVSPGAEGRFLKPNAAIGQMKKAVKESFLTPADPAFAQALIGETPSIIYSPFYIRSHVYDAILNRSVSDALPVGFEIDVPTDPHPNREIRFIPALCPECGWDLDGERDSLVLHCRNCRTLYQAASGRFKPLRVAHFSSSGQGSIFLPFYRIEASTSGILLNSYADLVLNANLPKVIQKGWENLPFHFWSPAFKIRPEDFLRLARNLTLSQPRAELLPGPPNGIPSPVTLSVSEAASGLKINLASFIKPPQVMLPKLGEITIKPRKALLVYVPFQEKGNDLSNPDFQLQVNKTLLRFARHL